MADLADIVDRSHALAVSKGWWDKHPDPDDRGFIPEKLMLVVSELAEGLESFRAHEPLAFYYCPTCFSRDDFNGRSPEFMKHVCGLPMKPEGLASELADVVIRVADLAGRLKIDLARAVEEKHAYNETRAKRHGGKAC